MTTYGSTAEQAKGIVRFNLADGTAARFATNVEPIDLNVGLDGKLYVLDAYGGLYVFDPATMAPLGSLTLPTTVPGSSHHQDYRAFPADAAGNLYLATWGNQVIRFDPAGAYQTSITLSGRGFSISGLEDIDVDTDGQVIVGSWGGYVIETTTALAGV